MNDSFLIGETTMNISDLIEIILALVGGRRGRGYLISVFFLNSDNQNKMLLKRRNILVLLCLIGLPE